MHRFGRSAQQKMKDRWGGGFILATILALVGAWYLGGWISNRFGVPTASNGTGANGIPTAAEGKGGSTAPHEFKLYFVQVEALRSQAGASKLARGLVGQSLTAMVAAKTASDLHPVMVGPFTTKDAADEAKTKLVGEHKSAFTLPVTVTHNPDAVPVAAMETKAGAEVRQGLDMLNSYLYQVAVWMESRTAGGTDGVAQLAAAGEQMARYASDMKAEKDATVQDFVKLMDAASTHATQLQTAAMAGGDDYQAALNSYMTLLDQYNAFHNGK